MGLHSELFIVGSSLHTSGPYEEHMLVPGDGVAVLSPAQIV